MKHVATVESELYDDFVAHLMNEYGAGRRVVLVIDEAQNLSFEGLEELRVLSNVNTGKDLLLQTILIGQPELRATLAQPRLQQFAQRISIEYHMDALSRDETGAYVAHRVQVAGGKADLFCVDAIDSIHAQSNGVPRVINQLCESALVYAFADQRSSIDEDIVGQVIDDRRGNGLAGGGTASLRDARDALSAEP
jgi:type II secretory pathway predicted ATPase ExeA